MVSSPTDGVDAVLCLMAVCAFALGWLGWQALMQDRAADRVVAAMERAFPPDVGGRVAANGAVEIVPAGALTHVPAQPGTIALSPGTFAGAEALEFYRQGRAEAAGANSRLAASENPQIRAEELVRFGRVLRRERKRKEALRAYATLRIS